MSRSYNSRKGHYGCSCRRNLYESNKPWYRARRSRKIKAIKFDGILYSYKRSKVGFKDGYWTTKGIYDWDKGEYVGTEVVYKKYNVSNKYWPETYWNLRCVIDGRKSYQDWEWLKGGPNKKGWCPSRYHVYYKGKWMKRLYPSQ